MLLDDVMSELDQIRRRALVALLMASGGQSVITTTDLEHVPGADEPCPLPSATDTRSRCCHGGLAHSRHTSLCKAYAAAHIFCHFAGKSRAEEGAFRTSLCYSSVHQIFDAPAREAIARNRGVSTSSEDSLANDDGAGKRPQSDSTYDAQDITVLE